MGGSSASPVNGSTLAFDAQVPCNGSTMPTTLRGTLTSIGGPTPPSTDGYTISYQGMVQRKVTSSSGTTYSCTSQTGGTATTNGSGTDSPYVVSFQLPPSRCIDGVCDLYSGPYAPTSVSANFTPAGYFPISDGPNISWVYALSSVSLSPSANPIVVSTGAPIQLQAVPLAANGNPSPASSISYQWSLQGNDGSWSFQGGTAPTGPTAVLLSGSSASSVTLTVSAQTTYDGVQESTAPRSVTIQAVPTQGGVLTESSTSVDSGQTDVLFISGVTAAPNYTYTATFYPNGSAEDARPGTCQESPLSSTQVSVQCSTTVTYFDNRTSSWSAVPTAEVGNGFSETPLLVSPNTVEVYPALTVSLVPNATVVNTNAPVIWTLSASGGAPNYRFCFRPTSNESWVCTPSGGSSQPSQNFPTEYTVPGTYVAEGSILDGSQVNVTVETPIRSTAPLMLGPITGGPFQVDQGTSVTLTDNLTQGAAPYDIWWNWSGTNDPICPMAEVIQEAPVHCTFVPQNTGTQGISLSVRDATGREVTAQAELTVASRVTITSMEATVGSNTALEGDTLQDEVGALTNFNATFSGGTAPYRYTWSYNGVQISQSEGALLASNVSYIWSDPGTFSVNFTVADSFGELEQSTIFVRVSPSLSLVAVYSALNPLDQNVLDNLTASTSGGVAPYTYSWSFGDGYSTVVDSPSVYHSWANPGNYTVDVTVTDSTGMRYNGSVNVSVVARPSLDCSPMATPNPTDYNLTTTLVISCLSGGVPLFAYTWTFGDGTTSTTYTDRVVHKFMQVGGDGVTVTVRDADGETATSSGLTVLVEPDVTVSIPLSPSSSCPAVSNLQRIDVNLTDSFCAVPEGGVSPYSVQWTVDSLVLPTNAYQFSDEGNYTVTVTVTDAVGDTANTTLHVQVVPPPSVMVTTQTPILDANQTGYFTAALENGTGNQTQWQYHWKVGGSPVSGSTVSLNWTFLLSKVGSVPANISIALTVVDAVGGIGTGTVRVHILPDPSGTISLTASEVDEGARLNASVSAHGGKAPYVFQWNIRSDINGTWTTLSGTGNSTVLPTQTAGSFQVEAVMTDLLGYSITTPAVNFTVNGNLATSFSIRTGTSGNATSLVGQPVILVVCVLEGGTAPFFAGFGTNGSHIVTWVPMTSQAPFCAELNVTYVRAGAYWVAGVVRDATNETSPETLLPLQILDPATAPIVTPSNATVAVENTTVLQVLDSAPFAQIRWLVPTQDSLEPQAFPNGSLEIRPQVVGRFVLSVEAQVVLDGVDYGPSATTNVTLRVVPGPLQSLEIEVSNDNYTQVVGTNFTMIWTAVDAWGNVIPDYSENLNITVFTPSHQPLPPGESILSPNGGVSQSSNGTSVRVGPSAWREGTLELIFRSLGSGGLGYTFSADHLPSWPGPARGPTLEIDWTPDVTHLKLFQPVVVFLNATTNHTRWEISDVYGNPIPNGYVVIHSTWGTYSVTERAPIWIQNGSSFIWLNYTIYGTAGGNISVVSEYGEPLIPYLGVPPPGAGSLPPTPTAGAGQTWYLLILGLILGLGGTAILLTRLRARRERRPAFEEASPEDLERDAMILEAIRETMHTKEQTPLSRVRDAVRKWDLPDSEIILYLQRLITEGTIRVARDPQGPELRFLAAQDPHAAGDTERTAARIELDSELLDRFLQRKDHAPEEDPPE